MKKVENECCQCASALYPCIGDSCKCRHVPHWYCDKCKNEFEPEELYLKDDKELCTECLLLEFETVAQKEDMDDYD